MMRARPFFLWELQFADVFRREGVTEPEQNGFDIVIANPPYIRHDFEPLRAERLPSLADHEGDELRVFTDLFKRLSHVNHPVRKNLYFLDNLESIRFIEGK